MAANNELTLAEYGAAVQGLHAAGEYTTEARLELRQQLGELPLKVLIERGTLVESNIAVDEIPNQ